MSQDKHLKQLKMRQDLNFYMTYPTILRLCEFMNYFLRKCNILFFYLAIALSISITSCSNSGPDKTPSEGESSQEQTETSEQSEQTETSPQTNQLDKKDYKQSYTDQTQSNAAEHPSDSDHSDDQLLSEDLPSQPAFKTIQEQFNLILVTKLRDPSVCSSIMNLTHQAYIHNVFYPHQTLQLNTSDTNTFIELILKNFRFASLENLSYAQNNFGEKLATTMNNKDCSTLSDVLEYVAQTFADTANTLMIPMMDQLLSLEQPELFQLIEKRDLSKDNLYKIKSFKTHEELIETTIALLYLIIAENYQKALPTSSSPFADTKTASKEHLYRFVFQILDNILNPDVMVFEYLFPVIQETTHSLYRIINNQPEKNSFFGYTFYSSNLVVENNMSYGKIIGTLDGASEQDRNNFKIGDKLLWYKTSSSPSIIKFSQLFGKSFFNMFLLNYSSDEHITVNVNNSDIGLGSSQNHTVKTTPKTIDDIPSMGSAIVPIDNSDTQKPVKVGYIFLKKLLGFQSEIGGSAKLVSQQIDKLKKQGADILFLDISLADMNLSKASFLEAIKVHDIFVKQNSTVYAYNRSYHNFSANTELEVVENTDYVYLHDQIPLVVYIGSATSGASELLAALFKLSKRALLIGDSSTDGFNYSQALTYANSTDGSEVSLGSIPDSTFFLADGSTFVKDGVLPNILLNQISFDLNALQKLGHIKLSAKKMVEHLNHHPSTQPNHYNLSFVNDQLIKELLKLSAQRTDQDGTYQMIKNFFSEHQQIPHQTLYEVVHSINSGAIDLNNFATFKDPKPENIGDNLLIGLLQTSNLKDRIIYEQDESTKTQSLKKILHSSPSFKEAMNLTADYFSLCTLNKTDVQDKLVCEFNQLTSK